MSISAWLRPLAPTGDEPLCRLRWKGPSSYTQVTAGASGAAATGGDKVTTGILGVSAISFIRATATNSACFVIVPIRLTDQTWTLEWVSLTSGTVGGQSQTAGAQAASQTDLSAEYCRLEIVTQSG